MNLLCAGHVVDSGICVRKLSNQATTNVILHVKKKKDVFKKATVKGQGLVQFVHKVFIQVSRMTI